jgi:hypothetical protein
MAFPPKPPAGGNKPGDGQVESYERTTKTGQKVEVGGYSREAGQAADILQRPGRVPMAAKPGVYPQNRGIPGVFAHKLKANVEAKKKADKEPDPSGGQVLPFPTKK